MAGAPERSQKEPSAALRLQGPGQLRRRKNLQLRAQVGAGRGPHLSGPHLYPAKELAYFEQFMADTTGSTRTQDP